MLFSIEAIKALTGVLALVTGELPSFLFGGDKYIIKGRGVRLLGLILIAPLPLALAGGFILPVLYGEEGETYGLMLEFIVVGGVGVIALILGYFIRQPANPEDEIALDEAVKIEALIQKNTESALLYVILSTLVLPAIIFCPLAIVRATRALHLINEHQVGEHCRRTADIVRKIAIIVTLIIAVLVIIYLPTLRRIF